MHKILPKIIYITVVFFSACTNSTNHTKNAIQYDSEGTPYNNLFLDSIQINHYIYSSKLLDSSQKRDFATFYKERNYQCAWFDSRGIGEQADHFLTLNKSFSNLFPAPSLNNSVLDTIVKAYLNSTTHFDTVDNKFINTELDLTTRLLLYAQLAYAGRQDINAKELAWLIPRKKVSYSGSLDSLLENSTNNPDIFEPSFFQYKMLKTYLQRYVEMEKTHPWKIIQIDKKQYIKGDSSNVIAAIKERLFLMGDFSVKDTSKLFNDSLSMAIAKFQHRYGIKEDSTINASVINEINRPLRSRIQQMIVNLERLRWVPDLPDRYIVVNIPEFRIHIYDHAEHQWAMDVVVGKPTHNTNIFSAKLQYVVFSPYWNVPYSIVKNEMGRSASYFSKRNMVVVGKYSDDLPIVRQKPGASNSLGKVKFLFPNAYNIYFHDTPEKALFRASKRAFSHGCIRLAEPAKLAAYLLQYDPKWTKDSIAKAMNRKTEQTVTLPKAIPVFIGYFTSWVDDNGQLNFRDDIYGYDKNLIEKLFSK